MDYALLGKRIKESRQAKHMTQEDLAQKVDCNVSHISNIENNHTKVSLPTLLAISNALDTTIDMLLMDQYSARSSALDRSILERLNQYDTNTKLRYLKILELL